jgi:hypothetical protein
MEQKVFDVDNLINEIYNEFSWVFADNKKYIKLVNIIQKNINELQEENERLKTELAELKQNAIVPKFKVGDEVWFLYDENDDNNFTIMHKKVMAFTCGTYDYLHFEYAMSDDGTQDTIWYGYINEKFIFATKSEAEEALKKLEENNVKD